MIETVQALALVDGPASDVAGWVASLDGVSDWKVEPTRSGYPRAKIVLDGLVVKVAQSWRGVDGGRYVVSGQGNLATLLHGVRAKAFSLRPDEIGAASEAYVVEVRRWVPAAGASTEDYLLTRVDASATWRMADHVAALTIERANDRLTSMASGRSVIATYGASGTFYRRRRDEVIRVYDKTKETLDHYKGSGVLPRLGPGRLVRLEVQHRKQEIRKRYGKYLSDLVARGATVAESVLGEWLKLLGGLEAVVAAGSQQSARAIVAQLVEAGASPAEAIRLVGPVLLLPHGGVDGLMALGLSQAQAYKVRARLRELGGGAESPPETRLALDAVVYAVDELARAEAV